MLRVSISDVLFWHVLMEKGARSLGVAGLELRVHWHLAQVKLAGQVSEVHVQIFLMANEP